MNRNEQDAYGQMGNLSAIAALLEVIVDAGEVGGFGQEFMKRAGDFLAVIHKYCDTLLEQYPRMEGE